MPYLVGLTKIRLKIALSQAKLARQAGVDRETVSRCEHGYSIQDVSCVKIRDALVAAGAKEDAITIADGGETGSSRTKNKARKRSPGSR